jgi:hypothetical protein
MFLILVKILDWIVWLISFFIIIPLATMLVCDHFKITISMNINNLVKWSVVYLPIYMLVLYLLRFIQISKIIDKIKRKNIQPNNA